MPKYIDADAFIEAKRDWYCKNCRRRMAIENGKEIEIYKIGEAPCKSCGINDIIEDIYDFEEADIYPKFPDVMPIRTHAHWEPADKDVCGDICKCSNCGGKVFDIDTDKIEYCPYCGAKMDKE